MANADVSACLLIIGDEILSGRTQDANLAYIARWLNSQGIQLAEARVLPDDERAIVAALNQVRACHDYVFTTGGIGPTHDDITVDSVAKAFGVPVIHHPQAVALLEAYYKGALTERRLRMARAPEGATLIESPGGGAPGIRMDNVFMLAGIPSVARGMLEGLSGKLAGGRVVLSRTVGVFAAESAIAQSLERLQRENADVAIGSYPLMLEGRYGANLVVRAPQAARVDAVASQIVAQFRAEGLEVVDGEIQRKQ
ncbi:MAG: competence/damage-inducible protein A [Alphaproteobacteria bacterium]|nr:MAG: competence/damage-inducible protein A [Alphaproteobacteria bacterium]